MRIPVLRPRLFGSLFALCCLVGNVLADPSWWRQSESQVLRSGVTANNYAVANLGQLKWMARNAKIHLDVIYASSGGAGTAITNLVDSFEPKAGITYSKEELSQISQNNNSPVNLGQVKAVARLFYDRLQLLGYNTRASLISNGYTPPGSTGYAWDESTPQAANYALANVGQLKLVFSFDADPAHPPADPTAGAPIFSPVSGTYYGSVSVVISSPISGATIHYTLDGSEPTIMSPIYSTPIFSTNNVTVRAVVTAPGYLHSAESSASYTITPSTVPPVQLNNFDYAVLRYKWTSSNGTDLDTRTAFTNVSPIIDEKTVGWHQMNKVTNNTHDYLSWRGDNRNSGVEGILVDFKAVAADFPTITSIPLRLRSFWYGTRLNGNIQVEFTTYLGGTMIPDPADPYNFINQGGILVQTLTQSTNVTLRGSTDLPGEEVGTITYTPSTKKAVLQIVP